MIYAIPRRSLLDVTGGRWYPAENAGRGLVSVRDDGGRVMVVDERHEDWRVVEAAEEWVPTRCSRCSQPMDLAQVEACTHCGGTCPEVGDVAPPTVRLCRTAGGVSVAWCSTVEVALVMRHAGRWVRCLAVWRGSRGVEGYRVLIRGRRIDLPRLCVVEVETTPPSRSD